MKYLNHHVYRLTTPAELAMVYRFRYKVYVEQMNRPGLKNVDHERKIIVDEWDHVPNLNLGIFENDQLIGVVRYNKIKRGTIAPYNEIFHFTQYHHFCGGDVSFCGKLITDRENQLLEAPLMLMEECFRLNFKFNTPYMLIDCNDHLVKFFTRHGLVHSHKAHHPEYGDINIFVCNNFDEDYFKAINSPFYHVLMQEKSHNLESPLHVFNNNIMESNHVYV
ncbi:hypothetical protein M899_1784 [Bacteriovorax sp. BSW11_IV]|uniref:hypothetical protein n=1 Tax=Bacteriovorax sp. BSW11_IV TaxID=1353529 RepID=UPI000389EC2C|nr:hypothetical protein [Bacteriovorax sp. BSW11_IV]EQC43639.1 hypothetical protein M899_1784 [Bacteriovorax sp. BSW11_IV]